MRKAALALILIAMMGNIFANTRCVVKTNSLGEQVIECGPSGWM